jgi:hypothetical protein
METMGERSHNSIVQFKDARLNRESPGGIDVLDRSMKVI